MWHKHARRGGRRFVVRGPRSGPRRELIREWRLPGPERRAAREERRTEAAMRRERDSEWTAERRAAAIDAERRRNSFLGGN